MLVRWSGSRSARSKSTIASNASVLRSQSLTSCRIFSRLGFQAPGRKVSFSNGVSVAAMTRIPRAWPRTANCFSPADHLRGAHLFLGLGPPVSQIVGAEHDDDVRDAGLGHHVSVE